MPSRPHWKGYLKLSLVSCPIVLYPVVSAAERVSFRQVNKQTGNRLRQQLVDAVTGEVVEAHNKARGYEIGEQQHLLVENRELDAARHEARVRKFAPAPSLADVAEPADSEPAARGGRPSRKQVREIAPSIQPEPTPVVIENTRTIEIEQFIRGEQLDARYYNTPFYISPREEVGQEAFAVIREAMACKGVVGLARIILAKRERPIMIAPMGSGLCGITLRYAHEVRSATEYFEDIPRLALSEEMIQLAEHIIDTKTDDFDVAYLEDRYRTVLLSMLKDKQAEHLPHSTASNEPSRTVIDLMEVLKRSVDTERGAQSTLPKPVARRTLRPTKPAAAKRPKARRRKAR